MSFECKICVLDKTVSDFEIQEDGICNYCKSYYSHILTIPNSILEKEEGLKKAIQKIKLSKGKNQKYDCIIGLSGGVDSSFLALKAVEYGLNPLIVHVDTGWNSEVAVMNVYNIINKLNLDLYTYVVNWEEMRDLQVAFLRSSVPDCDIPQDHVFPIILNKIASKFNLKYILSGHNVVGEFISPSNWMYDSNDLNHLLDIQNQFGSIKLKDYPKNNLFSRYIYYRNIKKIESIRLLYFINYNREMAINEITTKLNWKSYGAKHEESRFTKFFQKYYLFEKFGFDKRKAHLSNQILSGEISKSQAIEILKKKPYDEVFIQRELPYTLRKLKISKKEWEKIMKTPPRTHKSFKSDYNTFTFRLIKLIARFK